MSHISIIVPVFNAEDYLERCIESILKQKNQDFELILVDDGSTDQSGKICDKYTQKDSRIKVVHKENGGVSTARNAGMDKACGEYITFIDADDYIEENYLQCLSGYDADMICSSFVNLYENGDILPSEPYSKQIYRNPKEIRFAELYQEGVPFFVWGKFFRRKWLEQNGARFHVGVQLGEDGMFVSDCFRVISSLVVLPEQNYVYITYGGQKTLTSRFRKQIFSDVRRTIEYDKNNLRSIPASDLEEALQVLDQCLLGYFQHFLRKFLYSSLSPLTKIKWMKQYLKDPDIQKVIKGKQHYYAEDPLLRRALSYLHPACIVGFFLICHFKIRLMRKMRKCFL